MTVATAKLEAAAKAVARVVKPIAIGPAIDMLNDLREAKRKLEAQVKEIEIEYADIEERLMAKLEAEGSTKGSGRNASASITSNVVGNVTDWDQFYAFIAKKKFFHLMQRRLSDAAVRELFEQGMKVPGVEPFTKKRLNLRAGV